MSKRGKVLVAMSGGIDSAVTALLLHEEGYEVVGITMKTWDYANSGSSSKETGCCSLDSINDAREMAVKLGFHHFIIDIREEFGDYVIDDFVDEYMAGRTPNPCVLCNTHIKWSALLKRADILDCEFIATGHYAKIKMQNDRYFISKSVDDAKDQSYVLWGLSQECMARTLFPLSELTKPEVRKIAYDAGFVDLSKKGESYEICFVPDNDYRSFLRHRVPEKTAVLDGGAFLNTKGEKIGTHKGYPFYTIGQRRGLGMAFQEPMYVSEIRASTNEVVLGRKQDLMRNGMYITRANLMKYTDWSSAEEFLVKVRYHDKGVLSLADKIDDHNIRFQFLANVSGVAPGQSAVFYEGDDIVGGGIISKSL